MAAATKLGTLCCRGHDVGGGKSRRRRRTDGSLGACIECERLRRTGETLDEVPLGRPLSVHLNARNVAMTKLADEGMSFSDIGRRFKMSRQSAHSIVTRVRAHRT